MKRSRWAWIGVIAAAAVVALFVARRTALGREAQFVMGGALIDAGYLLQDDLSHYDFQRGEDITPEEVWEAMLEQNRRASGVRARFPRTARHPLVAIVACMDARIDTNELVGDTRRFYYVIRTAGSVMSEREAEMLELAAANGVKLVVLTTHSDCAAEKTAAHPQMRERFPALSTAVDERDQRVEDFLTRPAIAAAIADGRLAVKRTTIETLTERLEAR